MPDFNYEPMFQVGEDQTTYKLLSKEHVSTVEVEGRTILKVAPEALTLLAGQAFTDVSHLLRTRHLESLARIVQAEDASENDRYVALDLLRNAVIAANGTLPGCQDTGTATVVAKKGQHVWTEGDDGEALSRGVFKSYNRGQPALLAARAAEHVRREEHRHQPAGADRYLRQAGLEV